MFPSIEDYQRKGVCAMGAHLDVAVHNISQALKENGMWDNTLFIFANDNGENYVYTATLTFMAYDDLMNVFVCRRSDERRK